MIIFVYKTRLILNYCHWAWQK